MRQDLVSSAFTREFICKTKKTTFISDGTPLFQYFFEDHDELLGKLQIMENYNAIYDTSINSVPRFRFAEEFVDYLVG